MRIVVAVGGGALLHPTGSAEVATERRQLEVAAGLAEIAGQHQLVLMAGDCGRAQRLELALRNALPDLCAITVALGTVVGGEAPPPAPGGAPRQPQAILQLSGLRLLLESGALAVCGEGAAVTIDGAGLLQVVEAGADPDLTAALLARRLDAELLMMLTDVDSVHLGWGTERDMPIHEADPAQLREHEFAPASIGPKVEAACRFVEATGRRAAVGALADAARIVRGGAGTQVAPRAVEPAIA